MQLQIKDITKKYKNKTALNHVSIVLEPGVYGFLGPNGAGKSTLMNILAGVIRASEGEILLDGKNVLSMGSEYRNLLGYLPQTSGYYKNFTGKEFLYYMAAIKGMSDKKYIDEKIEELLLKVNLKGAENKKIGQYSGGMRQRLGIAQAFLNDSTILILDEPTVGLDPKERIRFRNLLTEMSEKTIIILATHIVSDVEYIADKLILIKEGEIVMTGNVSDCVQNIQGKVYEVNVADKGTESLLDRVKVVNINKQSQEIKVRYVADENEKIENSRKVTPMLEDLYMYYFG